MTALLEHTREMSFLEAGDLAVVTRGAVRFRRLEDGSTVDRPARTIALDAIAAAKSGYKHFMLKEIFEQPRAISDTLLGRVDRATGRVVFDQDLKMDDAFVTALPRITFLGCGTAGRLVVRASGTEPVLRITVEARDDALARRVAESLAAEAMEALA